MALAALPARRGTYAFQRRWDQGRAVTSGNDPNELGLGAQESVAFVPRTRLEIATGRQWKRLPVPDPGRRQRRPQRHHRSVLLRQQPRSKLHLDSLTRGTHSSHSPRTRSVHSVCWVVMADPDGNEFCVRAYR